MSNHNSQQGNYGQYGQHPQYSFQTTQASQHGDPNQESSGQCTHDMSPYVQGTAHRQRYGPLSHGREGTATAPDGGYVQYPPYPPLSQAGYDRHPLPPAASAWTSNDSQPSGTFVSSPKQLERTPVHVDMQGYSRLPPYTVQKSKNPKVQASSASDGTSKIRGPSGKGPCSTCQVYPKCFEGGANVASNCDGEKNCTRCTSGNLKCDGKLKFN